MLAPRPASAFANENAVHSGAPTQSAKKGLQAKRGLNGTPIFPVMHALSPPASGGVHSSGSLRAT
jgi:hypothetical protein